MLERLLVVALVMGVLAFAWYRALLDRGWAVAEARNSVVLLLVLFENVLALSARSETRSLLRTGVGGNRILLVGVLGALVVHLVAMHLPFTQRLLGLGPVPPTHWLTLASCWCSCCCSRSRRTSSPSGGAAGPARPARRRAARRPHRPHRPRAPRRRGPATRPRGR